MAYVAGQKIRASELNRLPQMYYMTADVTSTVAYTTAYVNAVGLAFAAEANARYMIECFLIYLAPTARDIIVAWNYPAGMTGFFSANGLDAGSPAGGVGSENRQTVAQDGIHGFAGSDGLHTNATPTAYFQLAGTPGTVQLKFAQVSAGGSTALKAGSCMRVTKLT